MRSFIGMQAVPRASWLQHDSHTCEEFEGSIPFPDADLNAHGQYVGQAFDEKFEDRYPQVSEQPTCDALSPTRAPVCTGGATLDFVCRGGSNVGR